MKKILTIAFIILSTISFSQNITLINGGGAIYMLQGSDTIQTLQMDGLVFRTLNPPVCQFVTGGRVEQEFPYTYVVTPSSTSAENLVAQIGVWIANSGAPSDSSWVSITVGGDELNAISLDASNNLTINDKTVEVGSVNKNTLTTNITIGTVNYPHGIVGIPKIWQTTDSLGNSIEFAEITADDTNFTIASGEIINGVIINFIY